MLFVLLRIASSINITLFYRRSKGIPKNYLHLLPGLARWFTHSGSSYSCLKQISRAHNIFKPLKFDCNILLASHHQMDKTDLDLVSICVNKIWSESIYLFSKDTWMETKFWRQPRAVTSHLKSQNTPSHYQSLSVKKIHEKKKKLLK